MSKKLILPSNVLAAIGDYGHAKYQHDNDIITIGAWEDLITAVKRWHSSEIADRDARIAELEDILRYVRESAIYDNTLQADRIDAALANPGSDNGESSHG